MVRVGVALLVLVGVLILVPRAGAARCSAVHSHGYKATSLKTSGGMSCTSAHSVLRAYFTNVSEKPSCRQLRGTKGCVADHFVCQTVRTRGMCLNGTGKVVHFRETDP
jgi:hypothetical protein